jgi:deazaflavin-dependent oxidoreductase (nitroreductase family)
MASVMQSTTGPEPVLRSAAVRIPFFVPLFNPIARRLLRVGIPLGPNALLTVRGRKTGALRTTPVALLEVGGRRWVIGTFGDVNWVRNLRAAGEGILTRGRRRQPVRAVELSPPEAEDFYVNVLGPYARRQPLAQWLIGSVLQAGDLLTDPVGAAQRHPVFELTDRN